MGIHVGEALLRVCAGCRIPGWGVDHGKQSFPGIHSQAELGSDKWSQADKLQETSALVISTSIHSNPTSDLKKGQWSDYQALALLAITVDGKPYRGLLLGLYSQVQQFLAARQEK